MKKVAVSVLVIVLHAMLCRVYAYATSPVDLLHTRNENALAQADIVRLLVDTKPNLADATGWAGDLETALLMNGLPINRENACAMMAVIGQESGFSADPVVSNMRQIAVNKLTEKLGFLSSRTASNLLGYLDNIPNKKDSYLKRIQKVRTERAVDMVYRDIVNSLLKKEFIDLLVEPIERYNEIDTIGSMQVAVDFAIAQESTRRRKTLTMSEIWALRDLMYTRLGGLYYGAMQLLAYESGYSQKLHRFADFNAGRYASRNSAFQRVVAALLKTKLSLDGDLLRYGDNGEPLGEKSNTETALFELSKTHQLGLSDNQIRKDLLLEKQAGFLATKTFKSVRREFIRVKDYEPLFAVVPDIVLRSEKISSVRKMTTAVFAHSVNRRYRQCMTVIVGNR